MENTPPQSHNTSFTPLQSVVKKSQKLSSKTMIILGGTVLLTISAVVLLLVNIQQKQSTTGKAAEVPSCHYGAPPLPINEEKCGTVSDPKPCASPDQGTCKVKGACFECRFNDLSLRMICPCSQATPTPPPVCEKPYECLPADQCVPSSAAPDAASSAAPGKCANGQLCCVRKQPTPSVINCPVPSAVTNVKVSCPTCDQK